MSGTQADIRRISYDIAEMLVAKNNSHKDSALDPIKIFSKSSAVDRILVRIDDKLSKLAKAQGNPEDKDVDDLIGYLILLKIAREREPAEDGS
jgi:hypothetical protein